MPAAAASPQSTAARVWNIGELQSQIIQCVTDHQKDITLKDKITDHRYPFISPSSLVLVSRATADQCCGALFKALVNPNSTLHFKVTDLEFARISKFLRLLPSATLKTIATQSKQRKQAIEESKAQAELQFTQRFVHTDNVRQLRKYTWCLGTWLITVSGTSGLWVDYTCTQMGRAESSSSNSFAILQKLMWASTPSPYDHLEGAEYASAHEQRRRDVRWTV
ncbi:hypothetical protein LTR95_004130 [Oleoguttula sp. CCFEE 5521]